jgi:hypothetical protein
MRLKLQLASLCRDRAHGSGLVRRHQAGRLNDDDVFETHDLPVVIKDCALIPLNEIANVVESQALEFADHAFPSVWDFLVGLVARFGV